MHDFLRLWRVQKDLAYKEWGRDTFNPDPQLPGTPVTPVAYAWHVLEYWGEQLHPILVRQTVQLLKSGSDADINRLDRHWWRARGAYKRAMLMLRENMSGTLLIFPNQDAQIFWDAIAQIALIAVDTGWDFKPGDNPWTAFWGGAKEGGLDVAKTAGKWTVKTAETLGEASGAATVGALEELVRSPIVMAAGGVFVAAKLGYI